MTLSVLKLTAAMVLLVSSNIASANSGLSQASIKAIETALESCSGGFTSYHSSSSSAPVTKRQITPDNLRARLTSLSSPRQDLDDETAADIQLAARSLIAPSLKDSVDGPQILLGIDFGLKQNFRCSAHPSEGVSLFEYLVGPEPDDVRGDPDALRWLGISYGNGLGGVFDKDAAQNMYLRWVMHRPIPEPARFSKYWSDGIDDDLLANIDRAGLRSYLDQLANNDVHSIAASARMILANEAIANNQAEKARRLLMIYSGATMSRLIQLEEQGEISVASSAENISFWSNASRKWGGADKLTNRMKLGASHYNGGGIPVSSTRPSVNSLQANIDRSAVASARPNTGYVPVRALIDPSGKPIWVEACDSTSGDPRSRYVENWKLGNAVKLYNLDSLPKFTPVRDDGKSKYTWVLLPAVQFKQVSNGETQTEFEILPAERCQVKAEPIRMRPPPPMRRPKNAKNE